VDPHAVALQAARGAFDAWQDKQSAHLHSRRRALDEARIEAELMFRIGRRWPHLFSPDEQAMWIRKLAAVYDDSRPATSTSTYLLILKNYTNDSPYGVRKRCGMENRLDSLDFNEVKRINSQTAAVAVQTEMSAGNGTATPPNSSSSSKKSTVSEKTNGKPVPSLDTYSAQEIEHVEFPDPRYAVLVCCRKGLSSWLDHPKLVRAGWP